MSNTTEQTLANHTRFLPLYHFVVEPILLVNMGYRFWLLTSSQSWRTILGALVGVALLLLFFFARFMAMTVQDRVIRLEERLRLARLLPADLQGRIEELAVSQLVALRFASDAELPALTRTVLEKGITDRREIKAMIAKWRPDYLRA